MFVRKLTLIAVEGYLSTDCQSLVMFDELLGQLFPLATFLALRVR